MQTGINSQFTELSKFRQQLPIFKYRNQLIQQIKTNQVTIIGGETGCGKTTQVPQYIYEANLIQKKIGITQPRKVAAINLAHRVSQEKNSQIGKTVGYSVRFDECYGKETKIKYMTDGMLLRECIIDPQLNQLLIKIIQELQNRYSVIIIDEAHERTINSDILLLNFFIYSQNFRSLLKQLLIQKKDLKLIIMSATIEIEKFSTYFQTNSVSNILQFFIYQFSILFEQIFLIEGRFYPIQLYFTKSPQADYIDAMLNCILQIHFQEEEGDILCFVTGQEDITDLQYLLTEKQSQFPAEFKRYKVCPLYAALPQSVQFEAFQKCSENERKIVLSTNIAETSITMDGIKFVIDCGLVKMRYYNSRKSMESLIIVPISKASAQQRAGRAGRQAEGKCFRLYNKESYDKLSEFTKPEILRINLAHAMLQLKAIGVKNIEKMRFIDPPQRDSIIQAISYLKNLNALDMGGELTEEGREIAALPIDPMYAKILLCALENKLQCFQLILNITSILQIQNIFYIKKDIKTNFKQILAKFSVATSDHLTKANVFQQYCQAKNKKSFCKEYCINKKSMQKAIQIKQQLIEYIQSIINNRNQQQFNFKQLEQQTLQNEESAINCICKGSINRAARINQQGTYSINNGTENARIHPESICFTNKKKLEYLIYNEVVITKKVYLRDVTEITQQQYLSLIKQ